MKKHTLCWTVLIFILLVLSRLCPPVSFAQQEDRSKEINEYIKTLNTGSSRQRAMTARKISTSGLTDKKLFDIINERLLKGYKEKNDSRAHVDEMAWYCKALVSSGRMEFRKTMEKVAISASNLKVSRHAWKNVHLFEVYAKRNELLKEKIYADKKLSQEMALYMGMLKSNILQLKRDGAKKLIKASPADERIYKVVNEELLNGLHSLSNDRDYIDMMAWLCKALGTSGMPQYRETLQKVFNETSNDKLKKHAKKGLKKL